MSNGRSIKRGLAKQQEVMPQEGMPEEQTSGYSEEDANVFLEEMVQDVDPAKKQQLEIAMDAVTQLVFDPRTIDDVKGMLQSGPPEMSLPKTTNAVFGMFEERSKQGGTGDMPLDVKLALGVHTFQEIMELGMSMQLLPEMDIHEAQPLLKQTMQEYIQRGLKDKSIDPIELQEQVNPLLTQSEREEGLALGQEYGAPTELTKEQSVEGMMQKKMQPLEVEKQGLQKQNQQMQGALQGIAQSGGQ